MSDLSSHPAESEPEPRRFADDSAEELEDVAAVDRVQEGPAELPTVRFTDREVSWLAFNARVLALAEDGDVPLLERVRFAAIFARNLDEFFMVRVATLRRRVAAGITTPSPTGDTPRDRLARVAVTAHGLATRHADLFVGTLRPALQDSGITLLRWEGLDELEAKRMRGVFVDRIAPVLTPLAVDPAHPFPYISGLSLNLAVVVRDAVTGSEHFARVKVPPLLPRYLTTDESGTRFVAVEEVIAAHLPDLFPGVEVLETSSFRVTRNEDLEVDDDVDNLLQALERELSRRRFGTPVRLEVEESMSDRVLELLVRELEISDQEVYRTPAQLDLAALWSIADLERPDLRYPAMVPEPPESLRPADGPADVFAAMRRGDILLHHPYDSFAASVQAFIEQAAADPDTHAIKLTLYRTSGESPIVDALVDAATAGKQVLVVVEIKARFDEQANIRWARQLEQAGCHVVYGLVGLKTHCKLALVVRSEPDVGLRRYVHVGTGNYNPKTARVYEDIGLLTVDPVIGADVADLFNHLSGYTRHRDFDSLLVAPDTLRPGLRDLIRAEARNALQGRPSGISIKTNSLVDTALADELYLAARAGVPIDLLVRGMCVLRPGVPGLSEGIRVRSILGRFLEHSRVYRFANDGDPQFWIGSADLMERNLDRRVEALVRVEDVVSRDRLDLILHRAWRPDVDCWMLDADARWHRTPGADDGVTSTDYQRLFSSDRGTLGDTGGGVAT
ncbi:MAG: polyphosphate kinase [Actinomycetota bacterium]|nr:polyphosphate kinase [Actinomycetota bacterium]